MLKMFLFFFISSLVTISPDPSRGQKTPDITPFYFSLLLCQIVSEKVWSGAAGYPSIYLYVYRANKQPPS